MWLAIVFTRFGPQDWTKVRRIFELAKKKENFLWKKGKNSVMNKHAKNGGKNNDASLSQ
jgi:hypothetical protein